jgi:hypothetical protein
MMDHYVIQRLSDKAYMKDGKSLIQLADSWTNNLQDAEVFYTEYCSPRWTMGDKVYSDRKVELSSDGETVMEDRE